MNLLEQGRFRLTVFDEMSELDGMSPHVVRQHFKEWRQHAEREEQGSRAKIMARGGNPDRTPFPDDMAVRYKFCVQIDAVALQSIVSSEGETRAGNAWVNLVEADWDPSAAAALRERTKREYLAMGLDAANYDDSVEVLPAIEGCTEESAGRMRVHYRDLILEFYACLRDLNALEDMYVRPPDVAEA